jgi:polyphenol oxidase
LSVEWPPAAGLATAKQIHSNQVLIANEAGQLGSGDAIISNRPGVTVAIRTADCLPIIIVDPRTRSVAAVHAGWRGVVGEIAVKAIEAMSREFGTRHDELEIAIGPGIGLCCFEVGPEVAIQFQEFFPERSDLSDRSKVDLRETVVRQLGRNGITRGQVDTAELCSFCHPELFESYRRDKEKAGRMIAAVGMQERGHT